MPFSQINNQSHQHVTI